MNGLAVAMLSSRAMLDTNEHSLAELREQMRQTRALIRRSEQLIAAVLLPGPCVGE